MKHLSDSNLNRPKIDWVDIPAGTAILGSPINEAGRDPGRAELLHEVTLSAFQMSRYPVSVGQFRVFITSSGYVTDIDRLAFGPISILSAGGVEARLRSANWKCNELGELRPVSEYDHPVTRVTWNDAFAFAEWFGCDLPREAEWEYACRAGTMTPFNIGYDLNLSQANFSADDPDKSLLQNIGKTSPVGSYAPNPWGLYDMHGLVWEWCWDRYGEYLPLPQSNPTGTCIGHDLVFRGGSWSSPVMECRSATRGYNSGYILADNLGFRLVKRPQ
jgi:sulfatase modifying factor 1